MSMYRAIVLCSEKTWQQKHTICSQFMNFPLLQGVVTTMCPVLPTATAIKKFDRQNGGLIV